MDKQADSESAKTRAQLGTTLMLATGKDEKGRQQSIDTLESMLKESPHGTLSAEVAVDLANLYRQAGKYDEAQKTLEFVGKYLAKSNLVKLELTDAVADPFRKMATKLLEGLKYDRDAGRATFEKAEALRKDEKFTEAAKAYQTIIKEFSKSDYSLRSQVALGQCFVGLDKPYAAAEQWKKFIAAAPAGPWRGQALAGLMDVYLENLLDLSEAGKAAEQARSGLATALADEKVADSWNAVAYGLYVRIGVAEFCQGKGESAADAFLHAKGLATDRTAAEKLDPLIAAAKGKQPVIPSDVQGKTSAEHLAAISAEEIPPQEKAALALSMGVIYTRAGRLDNAQALFDRVLGIDRSKLAAKANGAESTKPNSKAEAKPALPVIHPMAGAAPAQVAFAVFGEGAVLQAQNKPDQAKEEFQNSLRGNPEGSWHDETLYRLALLTQELADAKFGQSTKPAAPSASTKDPQQEAKTNTTKPAASVLSPTTQSQDIQDRAETQRLVNLVQSRAEALPYWEEILTKYPKSQRAQDAQYGKSALRCESAKLASEVTAPDLWEKAIVDLQEFVKRYPTSTSCGDAYILLIDAVLERRYDVLAAQNTANAALSWGRTVPIKPPTPNATDLWRFATRQVSEEHIHQNLYDIDLRAAVLAWLRNVPEDGIKLLADAQTHSDWEEPNGKRSLIRFRDVLSSKVSPITPLELKPFLLDEHQASLLRLADLYLLIFRTQDAYELYERILDPHSAFKAAPPQLEAYVIWRIGQSLEYLDHHESALAALQQLYNAKYANCPWVADGIYRMGVWTFNKTQDAKLAATHYKYVFTNYPDHPEAIRSLFLYGLNALNTGDFDEAVNAFELYLRRYPNTRWEHRIKDELLPQARKANS